MIRPEYLETQVFDLENHIKLLSIKRSVKRKGEVVEKIDAEYTLRKLGSPGKFVKSKFEDEKIYINMQKSIFDSFNFLKSRFQSVKCPKVLDAGCGWGRLLQRMRKLCPEDLEMVGIDTDTLSLQYGKIINKANFFVTSNIQMLPFKDEIFDIIICNGVMHEVEKDEGRYKATREIARVLKPNGLLYFHDIFSECRIVRFITRTLRILIPRVEWVLNRSQFEQRMLENSLRIIQMKEIRSRALDTVTNYQYIIIKSQVKKTLQIL